MEINKKETASQWKLDSSACGNIERAGRAIESMCTDEREQKLGSPNIHGVVRRTCGCIYTECYETGSPPTSFSRA